MQGSFLDIQNQDQNLQVFLGLLERKLQLSSIFWESLWKLQFKKVLLGALVFGEKWTTNHECPKSCFFLND